jgi:hypothetical protein
MEMKIDSPPDVGRLGAPGWGTILRRLGPARVTRGRPTHASVGSVVILGNNVAPRSMIVWIHANGS